MQGPCEAWRGTRTPRVGKGCGRASRSSLGYVKPKHCARVPTYGGASVKPHGEVLARMQSLYRILHVMLSFCVR